MRHASTKNRPTPAQVAMAAVIGRANGTTKTNSSQTRPAHSSKNTA